MPFIKLNDFYINLGHVTYVQEVGRMLAVPFKKANGEPMTLQTDTELLKA